MNPINPFKECLEDSPEPSSINITGNHNILINGGQGNFINISQHIDHFVEAPEKEKSASEWYLAGINYLTQENGSDSQSKSIHYEQAEICFNAAIHYNKALIDAWVGRGYLRILTHQYQQAIYDYQRALDLEPNNCIAIFNLAIALIGEKEMEDALVQLEIAKELGCSRKNKDIDLLIEAILKLERK